MKYLNYCQSRLSLLLFILIVPTTASTLMAQEDVSVKLADFSIRVETSGDEIKLTCSEGCAWKKLAFTSTMKGYLQAVDQYGMTTWPRDQLKKESLFSDFLFTIKRTEEGLSLEGKEGTMWSSLTLVCNYECFRTFDEYGITDNVKK